MCAVSVKAGGQGEGGFGYMSRCNAVGRDSNDGGQQQILRVAADIGGWLMKGPGGVDRTKRALCAQSRYTDHVDLPPPPA